MKKEQQEKILQLIAQSHAIGKPLIRRTRKSKEYQNFVKVKDAREELYQHTLILHKQSKNKSKSIAGSRPKQEGYVKMLGDDNKIKNGS